MEDLSGLIWGTNSGTDKPKKIDKDVLSSLYATTTTSNSTSSNQSPALNRPFLNQQHQPSPLISNNKPSSAGNLYYTIPIQTPIPTCASPPVSSSLGVGARSSSSSTSNTNYFGNNTSLGVTQNIPRSTSSNLSKSPSIIANIGTTTTSTGISGIAKSVSSAGLSVDGGHFDNLVSFGSDRKVDLAKLPLFEQPQQPEYRNSSSGSGNVRRPSNFVGVVSATSTTSTSAVSSPSSPPTNQFATHQERTAGSIAPIVKEAWNFDALLNSSSSSASTTLQPISNQPIVTQHTNSPANSADLLDDFFSGPSLPVVTKSSGTSSSPEISKQQSNMDPFNTPQKQLYTSPAADIPARSPSSSDRHKSDSSSNISKLVELGFENEAAKSALERSGNDVNKAVELLLVADSSNKNASNNFTDNANNMANRISKLTGISQQNAEKASKFLNAAQTQSFNLFTKAKSIVVDSSKKIAASGKDIISNRNFGADNMSYFDPGMVNAILQEQEQQQQQRKQQPINGDDEAKRRRKSGDSQSNIHEAAAYSTPIDVQQPLNMKRRRRTSPMIVCPANLMEQAEKYKAVGNEFFKKGQYADAELQYTKAVETIPSNHLFQITLLNNRAAARLKNGMYKETVLSDCTPVIQMCLRELEYEDVARSTTLVDEYKDAIVKAYLRRATAYENMEKWEDALSDYSKAIEFNPNAKGATDGLRRCGKAVAKNNNTINDVVVKTTTDVAMDDITQLFGATTLKQSNDGNALKDLTFNTSSNTGVGASVLTSSGEMFKSERVEAMRLKDQQKERDDTEKLRIKDDIDARIMAWKSKKENNLRALLSSLETILWQEMKTDWKAVTMAELVTPAQVKVRYMKVIGKLHPDKLSRMNLSIEQQLLANGILSALNDAWDSFKTQNNL